MAHPSVQLHDGDGPSLRDSMGSVAILNDAVQAFCSAGDMADGVAISPANRAIAICQGRREPELVKTANGDDGTQPQVSTRLW